MFRSCVSIFVRLASILALASAIGCSSGAPGGGGGRDGGDLCAGVTCPGGQQCNPDTGACEQDGGEGEGEGEGEGDGTGNAVALFRIDDDPASDHVSNVVLADGIRVDFYADGETPSHISRFSVWLDDDLSVEVQLDSEYRPRLIEMSTGYRAEIHAYLPDNTADVTYYGPDGDSERTTIDLNETAVRRFSTQANFWESADRKAARRAQSGANDECTMLEDFWRRSCFALAVVDHVSLGLCVFTGGGTCILDVFVTGPIYDGLCGDAPDCGTADITDFDGDFDGDGVVNLWDNCPDDPNPLQENSDYDGWGDECDPGPSRDDLPFQDFDGDGIANLVDGCPYDQNKTSPGECGCGVPERTPCGAENVEAEPNDLYENANPIRFNNGVALIAASFNEYEESLIPAGPEGHWADVFSFGADAGQKVAITARLTSGDLHASIFFAMHGDGHLQNMGELGPGNPIVSLEGYSLPESGTWFVVARHPGQSGHTGYGDYTITVIK